MLRPVIAVLSVLSGAALLGWPGPLSRFYGTPRPLARWLGARDLLTGALMLVPATSRPATLSRAVFDAADGVLVAVSRQGGSRVTAGRVAGAFGLAAAGFLASRPAEGPRPRVHLTSGTLPDGQVRVRRTVYIHRTPMEVYAWWRDLEHLPLAMQHVESVEVLDRKRSHWVANGPGGLRIEWDAEITDDEPGRLLSWRSLPGSNLESAGVVRFIEAPGGRGTELMVALSFTPPAGAVGRAIARLPGEKPSALLREDLRRVRQLLETGEITTAAALRERSIAGVTREWRGEL